MLGPFGDIEDVEIIYNDRGSKGPVVYPANQSPMLQWTSGPIRQPKPKLQRTSCDADEAREKLNGVVINGRRIEVSVRSSRAMTIKFQAKKFDVPTIPSLNFDFQVNYATAKPTTRKKESSDTPLNVCNSGVRH
uniref:RRM domain-containing protein n=1 Tax=Macrostomum lignano TaxID=282301 RepID=A0A1I8JQV8_9PLAT